MCCCMETFRVFWMIARGSSTGDEDEASEDLRMVTKWSLEDMQGQDAAAGHYDQTSATLKRYEFTPNVFTRYFLSVRLPRERSV